MMVRVFLLSFVATFGGGLTALHLLQGVRAAEHADLAATSGNVPIVSDAPVQLAFAPRNRDERLFEEKLLASLPVPRERGPVKKDAAALGVAVASASALVVDAETGKELFVHDAGAIRPLASVTKLLSALVLHDLALPPEEVITVTEDDTRPYGKRSLAPGTRVARADLVRLALGASANNAIATLVRTSGLSSAAFVERMNVKAKEIGMMDASFVEPVGLDPLNVASARDVERLLRAALALPEVLEATTMASVRATVNGAAVSERATNELLGTFLDRAPYHIAGGKTGYIEESGYNLAQAVESNGHRVHVVVLGAPRNEDRFQDVKALSVWVFENYAWE